MAAAIAFTVCNFALFPYEKPAAWINRDKGATSSIWKPGSTIIHGTEGRGVYTVDGKGYLNEDKPLQEDDCTLVVGCSFTQGKEVPMGSRYSDILNDKLSDDGTKLAVYNCSQDGYFFPDIISGFNAVVSEFPDVDHIVLEITQTDWDVKTLTSALKQRGYEEEQTGEKIVGTFSSKKRLFLTAKEMLPIYSVLKSQATSLKNRSTSTSPSDKKSFDEVAYREAMRKCLALIRSEYKGDLIILYHPYVNIVDNEGLVINGEKGTPIFAELCEENGIRFVDMSQPFLAAYEKDNTVPCGFGNTTMGKGHFNKAGHKIVAEELYKVLSGEALQ